MALHFNVLGMGLGCWDDLFDVMAGLQQNVEVGSTFC